jgi:chromosome segregation ATPase
MPSPTFIARTNLIRTFGAAGVLAVAAAALASATAAQQSDGSDEAAVGARIDSTREILDRWVETRRIISEEVREWALGKEILESRVDVVKRDLDTAKERVVETEKSITDADRKRAELVGQSETLKSASAELAATAALLEARVKDLVRRLPDPIREKIRPLSQRLPEDSAKSELSIAVRFQNLVGIVNEVNKFAREITMTSEIRKLADGSSAEVTVVYLGISQAYYAGSAGKIAGFGTSGADGWTWTVANDMAPQVSKLIAILKNESPAEFVPLPLKVD